MALEPVFAAFFAVTLGGESLTRRMLVGGALVAGGDVPRRAARDATRPEATAADEPPVEALHHDV